jgi:hypothetical protein
MHGKSNVRITFLVLGAFSTPQFDWARTTIPRRPRRVGKLYQPELAAHAIVRAALRAHREAYVGWPAVEAVLGNMFFPGLAWTISIRRRLETMARTDASAKKRAAPASISDRRRPAVNGVGRGRLPWRCCPSASMHGGADEVS